MSRVSCKALICEQNQIRFYVAVMNSADLKSMCFVSRKAEDPQKGFQRLLSPKRAKEITKYIEEGGVIPPAVILSAQPNAHLNFLPDSDELTMEKLPDSLLVLDGQHRLFGLFNSDKSYSVPVVIFNSLTAQEEVRQFIDINTTQRGVPTALLLDIKGQAGTETKIEERQNKLFNKINEDSVLAGYLSPNVSVRGKISKPTFYQATKEIYDNGYFASFDDEKIYFVLKNYLAAIDTIFKINGDQQNARLNKNILFKAVMDIFVATCFKCYSRFENFKQESFEEYLRPLSEIDYSKYKGTNKSTEKAIVQEMQSCLREEIDFSKGDMF